MPWGDLFGTVDVVRLDTEGRSKRLYDGVSLIEDLDAVKTLSA